MTKLIHFALCSLVATGAFAAQFHDFYVIPVAAHTEGSDGASWRTDVSIQNIQATPVTIEFAVVESGEGLFDNVAPVAVGPDGASSVTIPAGASRTLTDVLDHHRGRAATTGALLVGGDQEFAMTSRTYSRTPAGTVGQTVAAASDVAFDGSDRSSTLYLPGLAQNGVFRTNIGMLISATTVPLTVTVTIDGEDGSALGSRTFTVQPGATTHVQFSARSVASATFAAAGAVIRISDGSGTVIASASVVDNATGDASFINGGAAAAGAATPLSRLLARQGF